MPKIVAKTGFSSFRTRGELGGAVLFLGLGSVFAATSAFAFVSARPSSVAVSLASIAAVCFLILAQILVRAIRRGSEPLAPRGPDEVVLEFPLEPEHVAESLRLRRPPPWLFYGMGAIGFFFLGGVLADQAVIDLFRQTLGDSILLLAGFVLILNAVLHLHGPRLSAWESRRRPPEKRPHVRLRLGPIGFDWQLNRRR